MLLPCHACVPCGLLVVFGLSLPAASSQEAKKPPKTKRTTVELTVRPPGARKEAAPTARSRRPTRFFIPEQLFPAPLMWT